MTLNELKELAIHSVKRTAPTNYSVENVDAALADVFKEMSSSVNQFMKNRYDIYEIIIAAADVAVPEKTIAALGAFAEVQAVPQGQKVKFKRPVGRNRAKQFLTQVGLSGVYETFRLDHETFELPVHAVGGAVTVDFERVLDGAESLPELMDIITEGLTDAVFIEVQKALQSVVGSSRALATNVKSVNGWDASVMFKLVTIARAYGGGNAVIFACPDFIAAMGPDIVAPGTTNVPGVYSPKDIEAITATGYINIFRGTPVVQIPQSFVDEKNEKVWINPRYAYIFPTGKERVVKVALEGGTQIYDAVNRDQSIEVNVYRKMGVGFTSYNNWCIYYNYALSEADVDQPYGI